MEQMHTISADKTGSGLKAVFQEKIEEKTEKGSKMKSVILDPQEFIGKNENEVMMEIKDHCMFRIAERDGKGYELTANHLPFRWNLYINNNIVTDIQMF